MCRSRRRCINISHPSFNRHNIVTPSSRGEEHTECFLSLRFPPPDLIMAGVTDGASELKKALARDESGRAKDVRAFRSAIMNNQKRRSLAEAEPVRNMRERAVPRLYFLTRGRKRMNARAKRHSGHNRRSAYACMRVCAYRREGSLTLEE